MIEKSPLKTIRTRIKSGDVPMDPQKLLDFAERMTKKVPASYGILVNNMTALDITDTIAAWVKEPDKIFEGILACLEEKGITTDVQTISLRCKSAICLSIYLDEQTGK